ncbi:MAG: SDR family NAD(P)-dependent oxidoreductase [Hyphomonadaceae bacterium]
MKTPLPSDLPSDLQGRIILITGASRGIGYATAKLLAKAGAHIIALARTVGGLEELDDAIKAADGPGKASLIPVDLTNADAMDRLQPALLERFGKIDGFIANAGILGELSPVADITEKVWDQVMTTNLKANWRLTQALDPMLRQSDAGRVVYLTSGVARTHTPYWAPYSVSKAALEALALTYAKEVENTSMRVNVCNPGATRTAMRAAAMPGEDASTVPHPDEIAVLLTQMVSPSWTKNAEVVVFGG